MERTADPRGPPPLIPIHPMDKPTELVPLLPGPGIIQYSTQPDSPPSLEGEENYAGQKWRFSIHRHDDDKVQTLVDGFSMPSSEGKKRSENPCCNSYNQSTRIEGVLTSVSRPQTASNEEECIADRLKFLYEDPLLLQELVFQEKCRASSNELDLNMYLTSRRYVQVVTFCRLRRIYHAGLLSIRLHKSKPSVLVTMPFDAYRFASTSTEINQLSSDWTQVPSLVTELLSALDVSNDPTRYTILLYDVMQECWELVGCLDSSFSDVAPSQKSPEHNPLDFLTVTIQEEDHGEAHADVESTPGPSPDNISEEQCDAVLQNPMLSRMLACSPSSEIWGEPDSNYKSSLWYQALSNTPATETPEESGALQSPLYYSCPTFIFPTLAALLFRTPPLSPVVIVDDASISVEMDEPSITQPPDISQNEMERKNFKCKFCNKVFSQLTGLNRHIKIHDPSKWKKCLLCDFRTLYTVTLKNHVKKTHLQTGALVIQP